MSEAIGIFPLLGIIWVGGIKNDRNGRYTKVLGKGPQAS